MLALVRRGRLATIAGPGGVGKTRLAAQVADRLGSRYAHIWWVDLTAATSTAEVIAAVADVVDAAVTPADPLASAVSGLDADELLVLDGCEQVLDGVREVVDALRSAGPAADRLPAVVATSRVRLGVEDERLVRLAGMSPDDAVTLFVERADPGLGHQVPDQPARLVCDRLDRLPLAVELAAAWTSTLSVAEIAEMVGGDPLGLLVGGSQRSSYRQQSLAASVRWSHDLLPPEEQVVLRRLAAFRPGFTAAQAIAVCADEAISPARVLEALRALVDASLLTADTEGDLARYALLHTIGAFADERLVESGEAETVRGRHVGVMADVLGSFRPRLESDKDAWRRAVEPEYGNLVAALTWGLESADPGPARSMVAGLGWWWHLESHRREGLRLVTAAVAAGADERTELQAQVLLSAALVADTADPLRGYDWAAEAVTLSEACEDPATARLGRTLMAIQAMWIDPDDAVRQATALREEAEQAGDAFVARSTTVLMGLLAYRRADYRQAAALLPMACAALVETGDRGVASTGLAHLAMARARTGELALAEADARQSVAVAAPLHDLHRIGVAATALAEVLTLQGRLEEARAAMLPVQRVLDRLDESAVVPGWELAAARLALQSGAAEECLRWCAREAAWRASVDLGDAPSPETQVAQVAALRLLGRLDEARQVIDIVMADTDDGRAPHANAAVWAELGGLLAPSDPDAAFDALHESLALSEQIGDVVGCITTLEALARILPGRGAADLAVVLVSAAAGLRESTGLGIGVVTDPVTDHVADHDAVARGRMLGLAAVELARRMRGPRNRPASGWASLTPTEHVVVDLAVQGLSNPEIASRLFVGRGTVKTHLSHVYAKLGVANRTELAAEHATRPDTGPQIGPKHGLLTPDRPQSHSAIGLRDSSAT